MALGGLNGITGVVLGRLRSDVLPHDELLIYTICLLVLSRNYEEDGI